MTRFLLDTNVIAELISARCAPQVEQWAGAQAEGALLLSVLTLAEFDKGIANLQPDHPLRPRIAAQVRALEVRFAGRVVPLSDAVVRRWGVISGEVRRTTGLAPPVIDTLLAATAIEHGLVLVTRNVKDLALSGATLLNPWVVG